MKALMIATFLLLASVVPALAISTGGCCAWVGGSCISSCQKPGGCSGNGDCRLTWITNPSSSQSFSSGECKKALFTLNDADQKLLLNVAQPEKR